MLVVSDRAPKVATRYRMIVALSAAPAQAKEGEMVFEIPASCTLPTAEHPVRQAELENLFAAAANTDRVGATHLRISFTGGDAFATVVRDLADRESACCSFFDFEVSNVDDQVVLDIHVPMTRSEVLDGLVRLVGGSDPVRTT